MKSQRIIVVKLSEEKIWFNDQSSLSIRNSNLPTNHCKLTDRTVYWRLILHRFDSKERNLYASIDNYDLQLIEAWEGNTPKYKIDKVIFKDINWDMFSGLLTYYQAQAKNIIQENHNQEYIERYNEYSLSHKIRLDYLNFHNGYISYQKIVYPLNQPIEIRILNTLIFKELKYLKPYLSKIWNKQTINVRVIIKTIGTEVYEILADSPEVNQIDKKVLQVIKVQHYKDRMKERFQESKNVFIDPELNNHELPYFGNIDEFEKEILFSLLESDEVRNHKQLQYLSSLLIGYRDLYITVNPQFGFVFKVSGEELTHYVWELVNSHATYIWSMPSQRYRTQEINILKSQFVIISEQGRQYYRGHFQNSEQLFLNVINHSTRANPMVDHFTIWRTKLETLLI